MYITRFIIILSILPGNFALCRRESKQTRPKRGSTYDLEQSHQRSDLQPGYNDQAASTKHSGQGLSRNVRRTVQRICALDARMKDNDAITPDSNERPHYKHGSIKKRDAGERIRYMDDTEHNNKGTQFNRREWDADKRMKDIVQAAVALNAVGNQRMAIQKHMVQTSQGAQDLKVMGDNSGTNTQENSNEQTADDNSESTAQHEDNAQQQMDYNQQMQADDNQQEQENDSNTNSEEGDKRTFETDAEEYADGEQGDNSNPELANEDANEEPEGSEQSFLERDNEGVITQNEGSDDQAAEEANENQAYDEGSAIERDDEDANEMQDGGNNDVWEIERDDYQNEEQEDTTGQLEKERRIAASKRKDYSYNRIFESENVEGDDDDDDDEDGTWDTKEDENNKVQKHSSLKEFLKRFTEDVALSIQENQISLCVALLYFCIYLCSCPLVCKWYATPVAEVICFCLIVFPTVWFIVYLIKPC